MARGESVSLKVFEFCPENINDIFNGFIDHIQIGTGFFVEFQYNLLYLQTLRSCEPINAMSVDFRLNKKGSCSNCIVMYQVLPPFSHNAKT